MGFNSAFKGLNNSNCKSGGDHPMRGLCNSGCEVESYPSTHSQPCTRWRVDFQHHALAALTPERPVTLCEGFLLNVESGLDGQGNSCFPPRFNPLTVQSLESRLIAKVARNLKLVFGTSVVCFCFTFYLMISLGLNLF